MDLHLTSQLVVPGVAWLPVATGLLVIGIAYMVHKSKTAALREKLAIIDKEIRKERERLWVAERELDAERSEHRPLADAQVHLFSSLPLTFRELRGAGSRTELAEMLSRAVKRTFDPQQWLVFEEVEREAGEYVLVDGSPDQEGGWPVGARLNQQMGRIGLAARRKKVMGAQDFDAEAPSVRDQLAATEPRGFKLDVVAPVMSSGRVELLVAFGGVRLPPDAAKAALALLAEHAGTYLRHFEACERATRLENHDPLTGLHNRAYFIAQGAELLYTSRGVGAPCSVVVCAIDDFREFVAVQGHQGADRLLQCLSSLLETSFTHDCLLARWDADQFVVLLPGVGAAQALSLAEAVRRVVADPEWPYDEDSIKISVTLSAGVATFPEDGQLLQELQDAATKNLATARWAGGNQASHAFDPSRVAAPTSDHRGGI